ncbi:RTA1-domain-containing protein [Mycena rebaudengoi]|nr:RTA1-domain-containing protein [Mycena rebaudengoi]
MVALQNLATLAQLASRQLDPADAAALQAAEDTAQYGYIPQESVAILFLVLFGISTILHLGQATYFRTWWLLPTACLCGIGELAGWGGRLWSSFSPQAGDPYFNAVRDFVAPNSPQITTTIISPTPLLAVNFILLSRLVQRLGISYSWLPPKWYTIIFLTCDIVALVVQGVGGGMASSAEDLAGANRGANVMLAGIIFQLVAIIVYSALAGDYFRRYLTDSPARTSVASTRGALTPRLKIMIGALLFSTTVLFIRSIYRTIELQDGWTGRIIHTEVYFNVLDGGMVVLAIFTMNFAHPGFLLREPPAATHEIKMVGSRDDSPEHTLREESMSNMYQPKAQ